MFEFEYTLDDSVALAGRKMLRKYHILLFVLLPLVISSEYFIKFYKTRDYGQLTTAVVSIVLSYAIIFLLNKVSNKLSKNINNKFLGQKVNLLFSDSKVIAKTKKDGSFESSQSYEWNMIWKFKQDDSYYFVYLSRFKSYVIPKGACVSGNEPGFVPFVENKLKEKSN